MKKIVAIVLSLILALSMLCGCAFAEAAAVTGEWYTDIYGMVMTLTINEDGTYDLDVMGEVESGVWVLEGTQVIMDKGTDAEGVMDYDADAQILNMADELIFGREPIEAFVPAAARAAEAVEEFAGNWTATYVDGFGMLMTAEAIEMYMDVAIEGASVSLYINTGSEAFLEGEAVFADGVMTLTIPAESEYDTEQVFVISILEDGTLSIATTIWDEAMIFYLEPVVLEEVTEAAAE